MLVAIRVAPIGPRRRRVRRSVAGLLPSSAESRPHDRVHALTSGR